MSTTTLPMVCTGLMSLALTVGAAAQDAAEAPVVVTGDGVWTTGSGQPAIAVVEFGDDPETIHGEAELLLLPEGDGEDDVVRFFDAETAAPGGNLFFGNAQDAFFSSTDGPKLGVTVESTDDGVVVNEVVDGSLAASAGVQSGDLILRVGKTRVGEIADIGRALRGRKPGSEVGVTVVRAGEGVVSLRGALPAPKEADDAGGAAAGRWTTAGGPMLGVSLGESDHGAAVTEVHDGTGAWFAGLEKGDVIVALDGQAIGSPDDVVAKVKTCDAGDFLAIVVQRGGEETKLRARLGRRSAAPSAFHNLFGDQGRGLRYAVPRAPMDADVLRRAIPPMRVPQRSFQLQRKHMQDLLERHGKALKRQGKGAHAIELDGVMEWLEQSGLDGEHHDVRIQIEDGVMTIERDGEVETYELEAEDGQGGVFFHMPRPRNHHGDHDDDHDGGTAGAHTGGVGFERVSATDEV